MPNDVPTPPQNKSKATIALTTVAFVVLGIAVMVMAMPANSSEILSGVAVSGIELGRVDAVGARARLEQGYQRIAQDGLTLTYQDKKAQLPISITTNSDLVTNAIVRLDIAATAERAALEGHTGTKIADAIAALRIRLMGMVVPPVVVIDQTLLERFLHEQFDSALAQTRDARWEYNQGQLSIAPEHVGTSMNISAVAQDVQQSLQHSATSATVSVSVSASTPRIQTTDLETTRRLVEALLAKRPFTLTADEKKWELGPRALVGALRVDDGGLLESPKLRIDAAAIEEQLQPMREALQKPPVDARFTVTRGKVEEFSASQDGLSLDTSSLIKNLEAIANGEGEFPITLTTIAEPAKITIRSVNELGIEELLGVGKSNFKGSPKNRRHNIAVGAAAVNGTIIPASSDFSLVGVLGEIDGSTGYLPELVIKENKTIPEFGGGLCQIGTTVFRGALESGLPITERQNHSYRVVYYEPAGTDATIYPPHPDFKFRNDTGSAILIVSRLHGDDIEFEFWGKRDGRTASRTAPKIYNIRKPAATKIIETTDLKPGVRKCTEKAHDGADAEFTYTVMMPDGEKRERVFTSHYRPWQAVCLVGVEKKADTPTSSDTPTELPPPPDLPATVTPTTLPNPDLPPSSTSTPY